KDIVEQEHRPLAGSPFDQGRFSELQAHDRRSLLTLGGVGASLLTIEKNPNVVSMRTRARGTAPEVFGEGVIHSFCQVFRRPLVLNLQPLARRDFGVATSRLRREL